MSLFVSPLRRIPRLASRCRPFSSTRRAAQEPRSPHARFYSDLVPGMIPVALLGSAVYIGLQVLQTRLSLEKYLDEARAKVDALEGEVDALVAERAAGVSGTATTQSRGWWK
ncbi:hypothetical protein FA95DRAFT_1556655 [Auriscalpium vulgare]|uniref:Uncharacterized protein n=1 Tax=Auriscalpium vulgare TaxID=40419 RepID=A0ACB8S0N7_9AGAM|nr:hypothetical protein FA95DRAFT_1556655 [Auriscalpium vulgare]